MNRVVVTGMGIVSPLGCGVSHNWSTLIISEHTTNISQNVHNPHNPSSISKI